MEILEDYLASDYLAEKQEIEYRRHRCLAVAIVGLLAVPLSGSKAALVITDGPTQHMHCRQGVCTATAKNASLSSSDLNNMLLNGDVVVATGAKAAAIEVNNMVSWYVGTHLTLDSMTSIIFRAPTVISGGGGLIVQTNDGGAGGSMSFGSSGYVWFWNASGSLVINGHTYGLVEDLGGLSSAINADPTGYYALAASYDAKLDSVWKRAVVAARFSGGFTGLGNTISNMRIKSKKNGAEVGLFSNNAGAIANLRLAGVRISGGDVSHIGGIVGTNTGILFDDSVDGEMNSPGESQGAARLGLLAGVNSGTVRSSSSSGKVSAGFYGYVAGLVGDNSTGTVDWSHSSAEVVGGPSGYPGGLVSINSGVVSNSYATGIVHADTQNATISGGLVSDNESGGAIYGSYATGTVTTPEFGTAGGLAGGNQGEISMSWASGFTSDGDSGGDAYIGGLVGYNNGDIANCYSIGSVDNYSGDIGGLVGHNLKTITTSYSTGQVTSLSVPYGGFVGADQNTGGIESSYWNIDTSGISDPSHGAGSPPNDPGIAGLASKQLRGGLPSGFDPHVWGQDKRINSGFPFLMAAVPPRH